MKLLRTLATPALLAALVSLTAPPAHATPSPQDRADARSLVNDAKKAAKENRTADAVTALRRADALDPSPQLEMDLAKALVADRKLVESTMVLRVLSDENSKTTPKPIRDAAKKMLGEVEGKVPWLQVTVVGPADGKAITRIDDRETDASVEAALNPGEHKVEVTAEGFDPASQTVKVAEGAHEKVTITLTATPKAVVVEEKKGSLVPGIVTVSVGGAGLALGGIFGILAFSAKSAAQANCKGNVCSSKAADDISRSKTMGTASTISFIAGGALAGAGIVLLIVQPGGGGKKEAPKAGLHVTPWIGAGEGGFAGTF